MPQSNTLFKAIKLGERLTDRLNAAAERYLGGYFSVNVALSDDLDCELLESELVEAKKFAVPDRLLSWRRGRAALKVVLKRAGFADLDTSKLTLPHKLFSLTHSGSLALAANIRMHGVTDDQAGTGIDYENARRVNPRSVRFFLQPSEIEWLGKTSKAQRNFHLLRLWTIKEALFKADITNRTASRFPGQYLLKYPSEISGIATHSQLPDVKFLYATTDLDDGLVSVAVAVRGN